MRFLQYNLFLEYNLFKQIYSIAHHSCARVYKKTYGIQKERQV